MLQVSQPAVWLWVSQYNSEGPKGLERKGRGGRRWSYLSWVEEEALLDSFRERVNRGEVITAKHIYPVICEQIGKEISLDYVYGLLHRHGWRKIAPRPRHVKADRQVQEEFKKTPRGHQKGYSQDG